MPELYNPADHILLRDAAHQSCIHQEAEVREYIDRVLARLPAEVEGWSGGGDKIAVHEYEVEIPDWPIALRTPLPIIVFSIGDDGSGSGMGGPTARMAWEGIQPAIDRAWISERLTRRVGREMVPDTHVPEHRVGYAWQVKVFDPARDVVIRYWCRSNGVSIVDFWVQFYPGVEDTLEVFETTNPEMVQEKSQGSYSPTRRSIRQDQLYLLRNHYLGVDEEQPVPVDPESEPRSQPQPQPRPVHDDTGADQDQEVVWSIHDGVQTYTGAQVLEALTEAVGVYVRPFTGIFLDMAITATTSVGLFRYLASNPVSSRQYVRDDGGRNYDCDDFAFNLRTDLIRDHGYNSCLVIGGDVHAFCAFVVAGSDKPGIVFIEPQTDGIVTELSGMYSVVERCEAIL